jgi:hypothetical protein
MDIAKLFGVLVVGGSLLVGCDSEQPPAPADANAVVSSGAADSGLADDGSIAPGPDGAPTTGLEECGFCPNEACCVYDDEGVGSTKDGFECCWGTTC